MKKQLLVWSAGVVLLAVFGAAALIHNKQEANELSDAAYENASLLVRDYSPVKGDPDAKVTIVEFFDPACETCRAFYPFVEQLMEANPGKINLVLRYTPFHDGSDYVVKILEASRKQDKFWETLQATFASQPAWASHGQSQPERLWSYLERTGLDIEKAKKDMHSSAITDRIRQDMTDARQLQVTKTPGYFVNGKPLVRFGYEQLQELVESEVTNQY
jgi:protein-disulfide isomerase